MRRIQRRVRDSDFPLPHTSTASTSRSLTFDRKTFLECSKRMKGLVSTLGRQQNLKVEEQPTDCAVNMATSKTSTEVVQLDLQVDSECETETDQDQDNADDAEPKSQSDDGGLGNLNLPGPSKRNVPLPFVDLTVRSATFPNNYASADIPAKKRKRSRDPIWMIPFSHFVSFMSTIGGNVDIASYPPS